jgi:UDP-N-acetylmuramoyl-L-alanyl-D-glutamate--2,6-diaminopimelate ligase
MNARNMHLGDLLDLTQGHEHAPLAVSKIASDSRKVEPGTLFFAVPGTKVDGMSFVPQAVTAGAIAIVGEAERPLDLPEHVTYVQVKDVRRTLALAAARFYPKQPEKVVAVTGTSGKSSVADFIRQLFAHLGYKSASVGTLGIITSDGAAYGSLTRASTVSRMTASRALPWRPHRMASTNGASTACA